LTSNWRGIQAPNKLANKSMPNSGQSPLELSGNPVEVLAENMTAALVKSRAGMVLEASALCVVVGTSTCAENREGYKIVQSM
jgi:hypothetical protein